MSIAWLQHIVYVFLSDYSFLQECAVLPPPPQRLRKKLSHVETLVRWATNAADLRKPFSNNSSCKNWALHTLFSSVTKFRANSNVIQDFHVWPVSLPPTWESGWLSQTEDFKTRVARWLRRAWWTMVILLPCNLSTVTGKVLHKTGWRLFTIYSPHLSHHTCSINREMNHMRSSHPDNKHARLKEFWRRFGTFWANCQWVKSANPWLLVHLFNLLVTFHPNI